LILATESRIRWVFFGRSSNLIAIDVLADCLKDITDFFDVRVDNNYFFLDIFVAHFEEFLDVVELFFFAAVRVVKINMRVTLINRMLCRRYISITWVFSGIVGYIIRGSDFRLNLMWFPTYERKRETEFFKKGKQRKEKSK